MAKLLSFLRVSSVHVVDITSGYKIWWQHTTRRHVLMGWKKSCPSNWQKILRLQCSRKWHHAVWHQCTGRSSFSHRAGDRRFHKNVCTYLLTSKALHKKNHVNVTVKRTVNLTKVQNMSEGGKAPEVLKAYETLKFMTLYILTWQKWAIIV